MKVLRNLGAAMALLWILSPPLEGQELTIIELRHRPADEVIPIVAPFLTEGDTISGHGYTLFVRTGAQNLQQIRSIIRNLDRPTRQLMITVVQGENARENLQRFEGSAHLRIGDDIHVSAGDPPPGSPPNSLRLQAEGARAQQSGETVQRIRVSENTEARITVSVRVPVLVQPGSGRHRPRAPRSASGYREVMTGLSVVPRVSGDRFVLDLSTATEGIADSRRGVMDGQRIHTQVQGRLGEWVDIGGTVDTAYRNLNGGFSREDRDTFEERKIWIRIVEAR